VRFGPEYAELMTARLTSRIPVIFCLAFAAALFGQIDSYQLRAKYGPPLDRETFTISSGFQLIVDYGPDQQVCRLDLPLNQPGVSSAKQADDLLLELVPLSMRGKQLNSGQVQMGLITIKLTVHEHVVISESGNANDVVQPNLVSVSLNREVCRNP
jgi:hypothetical protein